MTQETSPLKTLEAYRSAYSRLHDMLSDMIEGGRLLESNIPGDYQALVAQISGPCNAADDRLSDAIRLMHRAVDILIDSTEAWDGEEDSVKEEHADLIGDIESFWNEFHAHGTTLTRPSARRSR